MLDYQWIKSSLDAAVKAGPVVLHIWALSAAGPSGDPLVITFNYIPPNIAITNTTAHYYLFQARVMEQLIFRHAPSPSTSTRLFLWYPNNYGAPDRQAAAPGSTTLSIPAAPLTGHYVLTVQGSPDVTSTYTLTAATLLADLELTQSSNSPVSLAVAPGRPFFAAPAPQLPLSLYQLLLPLLKR